VHGRIGRNWMAVRDMDIAAELIGIKLLPAKLLAFAVSSFYCGVAGAMLVFLYLGNAESESFSINQSFLVLFMVIIGGLGSLVGSFFGAALIYGLPIVLRMIKDFLGLTITSATVEHTKPVPPIAQPRPKGRSASCSAAARTTAPSHAAASTKKAIAIRRIATDAPMIKPLWSASHWVACWVAEPKSGELLLPLVPGAAGVL